eukprot:NODE_2_length_91304_cov_0.692462.p8 type:complete len:674 gc:universal NODE_2_length_91304_cov_0.692462:69465-71486(+)
MSSETIISYHQVFATYLGEKIDPSSRTNARQKLSLLSENQFGELATDIHDELKRRISVEKIPFLQVRSDFHPKRNQARQKLATLPEKRFRDLVIDVIVELERRFPELSTEETSRQSTLKKSDPVLSQKPETILSPKNELSPLTKADVVREAYNKEYLRETKSVQGSGDLNFASLDSLMKDLGDLVTGKSDSTEDIVPQKKKKVTESVLSLENLPKSEDTAKIRKEKELLEKKYRQVESDLEKERSKVLQCQKELGAAQIELQKSKSELETLNSKRGVIEKEVDRVKELLDKEKALRQAEKRELEQKLSSKDFEIQEKQKIILNMESIANQSQKALDKYLKEIDQLKTDNLRQLGEMNILKKKLSEFDSKSGNLHEQGSQTNLLTEIDTKSKDLDRASSQKQKSPSKLGKSEAKLEGVQKSSEKDINGDINKTDSKVSDKSESVSPNKLKSKVPESLSKAPSSSKLNVEKKPNVDINNLPWEVSRKTIVVSQFLDSVTIDDITPSVKGGVVPSRLGAFQNSVDTLLDSQKSGVPADILVAMKSIVIACKNITNDIEKFESTSASETAKESLTGLKTQLSSSLTALMTAAKSHATGLAKGSSKSTSEDIERGCEDLTKVIINILKIAKVKAEKVDEDDIPLKKLKDMSLTPSAETSPQKQSKSVMSSADLKVIIF